MTLSFTSLASGSNGNAYYIANGQDAILVDAGVSCRQIVTRMENLGLLPDQIKGIIVTHEHIDHLRGVEVMTKKFNLPVYVSEKTLSASKLSIDTSLVKTFEVGSTFAVGNLVVHVFSKFHDAVDPCAVSVRAGERTVSVITDLGVACDGVARCVADSDVLFLESNYDCRLLEESDYPESLKQRIRGKRGHLSNMDAAKLIERHASSNLRYLFLSHLSENSNTPGAALAAMNQAVAGRPDLSCSIDVADRYREMPLIVM